MKKFWFKRKDSRGLWWSVYVASSGEDPFAGEHERDFGVADVDVRRVYLNASLGKRHYPSTLVHEWYHVEEWAHDVARTSAKNHDVIDAAGVLASRLPRKPAPDIGEDEDDDEC